MKSQYPPAPAGRHASGLPPLNIEQAFQHGLAQHRSGQLQAAADAYRQVLARQPDHAGALHLLGVIALASGAQAQALQLIGRAAQLLPQDAGVQVNLALALAEGGRPEDALRHIDQALALQPQMPAAQLNRVGILIKLGRHAEALAGAEQLAAAGHALPELRVNQGIALLELQRPEEAIAVLEAVLGAAPQHLKALGNLAAAQLAAGHPEAAMTTADRALAVQPKYAEALRTKARALTHLGQAAQAEPLLRQASELQPDQAGPLLEHAHSLIALQLYDRAVAQVQKALAIDPQQAEAYVAGGRALAGLGRHEDAIANYDRALAIDPGLTSTHFHKAAAEIDLKRFAAAIDSLERCQADPALAQPVRMQICDWRGFEANQDSLRATAIAQKRNPFPFLAMLDDPQMHLELAQAYLDLLQLRHAPPRSFGPRRPGRIRVGYFSADYFEHATTYLMAELFESHDRERFEVHAFSFGPQTADAMRQRIARAVDQFHDVSARTDQEIAALARQVGIDIAVDLKGFTRDGRLGIFADRCAPVQVSYLGYPGTTGAAYMDYVIADRVVLPPEHQRFFTEQAVNMPHSYQVNDSGRAISARRFTRSELGLPEDGFVFCCFNNNYKILPGTFDIWMRILHAVPGSVLWLFRDNPDAAAHLVQEAGQRGVDGSRLVFAARMPLADHLARHRAADLFLDTLPYNAHTTASDALWAGLPVLTLAGRAFAGRVAASLLTAVGLPELITHTPEDYEAQAIYLATHPQALAALRERLAAQVPTSPLFDGKRFTRDLETAYQAMFERQQAGLPPAPISVAS